MTDIRIYLRDFLDREFFRIGNTPITPATILTVAVILAGTWWISRLLRRQLERLLLWRGVHPSVIGTVKGLLHYSLLVLGLALALRAAGIDLTALFAAGALFAVALGFAMQNIAQNFVAGVILLTERSIKAGDVLEVEGNLVRMREMGIRSSVAETRDGEDLVIPNATLIQTTVKNYTLTDSSHRIRATVGVAYASDMKVVKETLQAVVQQVSDQWSVENRESQVILTEFGDNAVIWEAALWITDPWKTRRALSDLHESIWWAFRRKGVSIAFPQVDLHLDPEVVEALRSRKA